MKKFSKAVVACIITLLFTSCLQNNGQIGPWYGMWKLTSLTINGVDDPEYEGNVFWKFQTGIVQMIEYDVENESSITSTGTWKEKGNVLELTYEYSDDSHQDPETSQKYTTLIGMHLPSTGVINLDINKKPGSSMKLTYRAEDGTAYVYTFKKW